MNAQAQLKAAPNAADDSAKRRQIVQGAREIFLARGFDAASMSDIARAAGVSKGTLYVYFENKEQLFEAIVHEECLVHAEGAFDLDHDNHDVEAVLTRLGSAYLGFLCSAEKASALRTVVGIAKLADYIKAQNEAGVLAVEDCRVAAAQFLDSCKSTLFMPVLFNFGEAPQADSIKYVVGIAVRAFMRAYRRNA